MNLFFKEFSTIAMFYFISMENYKSTQSMHSDGNSQIMITMINVSL